MDRHGSRGNHHDARGPKQHSLRLVFEQHGERLALASVQRVAMIAPPPQALRPAGARHGSWVELRDRDGQPVYRRAIHYPLDAEVVTDDPGRPLRRIGVDHPRAFFLVVPDVADARTLVLGLAPPPAAAGHARAAPIVERAFDIRGNRDEER